MFLRQLCFSTVIDKELSNFIDNEIKLTRLLHAQFAVRFVEFSFLGNCHQVQKETVIDPLAKRQLFLVKFSCAVLPSL